MRKKKFFRAILLSLVICLLAAQGTYPVYAADTALDSQSLVQEEYNLSPEAMSFLRDHNVDFSVFETDGISAYGSEMKAVPFSMNESILGLIQETDAYGFTDEQIQQYVDGLVNSDPIIAAPGSEQAYAATPPTSTRRDGPGFEVKSKSGYSQSTAFVTLPTAYNAGQSNSWLFYTVSSPTSNWGLDIGIFYASGNHVNAWRGFYTEQGEITKTGPIIDEVSAGSRLYFNAKIESNGYLLFRILNARDFSEEYYSLYYYVGSRNIFQSNGIFNRQITMTSNTGEYTNGSYIENAQFSDAYIYSTTDYSLMTATNTESGRRGAFSGHGLSPTVNSYTPWYAEDISIHFSA